MLSSPDDSLDGGSEGHTTGAEMKRAARVSIVIPVLDAEALLGDCLESIFRQSYPHEQIEVILADGGSSDGTLRVANRWKEGRRIALRVVANPRRIAEFGKAEALKVATGEFIALVDADNRVRDPDWMITALTGLELFPDAFGFESCYLPIPGGSALNNYLTACLHISDPLAWAAAIPPREIADITVKGKRFRKHLVSPGYPCGANGFVYRRAVLEPFVGDETFEEAVVPMTIARSSRAFIVTADGVGVEHHHVGSTREFLRKRSKIALKSHTRRQERDTWIDWTGARLYWAALTHMTIVWPLAYSLVMAVRRRSALWLLHAPIGFVSAWFYLFCWIRIRVGNRRAW